MGKYEYPFRPWNFLFLVELCLSTCYPEANSPSWLRVFNFLTLVLSLETIVIQSWGEVELWSGIDIICPDL